MMFDVAKRRIVADVLREHRESTGDLNCCTCGLWFSIPHDGPLDLQLAEHQADEVLRRLSVAMEAKP